MTITSLATTNASTAVQQLKCIHCKDYPRMINAFLRQRNRLIQ